MGNGSCDGGGDDGMEIEGGMVVASQVVLKQLFHFNGFQDNVEVEGEGGVVMTEIDEVEDVVFLLEETFDESKGTLKGSRVEKGGRHCERGWF